jgi:hypothetical protein
LNHVKFEGGLDISVLRKETKKWGSKPRSFQKVYKFTIFSNAALQQTPESCSPVTKVLHVREDVLYWME